MASVKVAVRIRPLNNREIDLGSQCIVNIDGRKVSISNTKVHSLNDSITPTRGSDTKSFTFDHSYWSVFHEDSHFVCQPQIFCDLGAPLIDAAFEGYNACIFAYGQTSSGKTYTMMGEESKPGLIPRICEALFQRVNDNSDPNTTYRTEVSFLEIYNERVRDLLRASSKENLVVREHPKEGPYVQGLSTHIVHNFDDIHELMTIGMKHRITASTSMNDTSSRSHAIFTIKFTQAKFSVNSPSETTSKLNLVDLAGSERAADTGAVGVRLKEGGSINKSLVSLGNVISVLADRKKSTSKTYVPYRDSVLTWLLKDSLGGNSKTVMVATISPADVNYAESLSTLRYANRAKNIINKPTVNEDPNVRLIRELKAEISKLKAMLGGHMDHLSTPILRERLHESEARVKVLTEEWQDKWREAMNILQEQNSLNLRKEGLGVVLDSNLPHLIGIDDDILSTGIILYHLKEGITRLGTDDAEENPDISLTGDDVAPEHCIIEHKNGIVTIEAVQDSSCTVNGIVLSEKVRLEQGIITIQSKSLPKGLSPTENLDSIT